MEALGMAVGGGLRLGYPSTGGDVTLAHISMLHCAGHWAWKSSFNPSWEVDAMTLLTETEAHALLAKVTELVSRSPS